MKEIMDMPDDIPQSVIDKADCVVVLPSVLKFAIGIGGSYGRGVMTCRGGASFHGHWGPPTMMALEGGSFGLQLGGQATDFVLLLMNQRAASSILSSKVKLGGDVSAAAGPVGRNASAETDVAMRAQICRIRAPADCSPEYRWPARRCGPTTTRTSASTGKKYPRRRSCSITPFLLRRPQSSCWRR